MYLHCLLQQRKWLTKRKCGCINHIKDVSASAASKSTKNRFCCVKTPTILFCIAKNAFIRATCQKQNSRKRPLEGDTLLQLLYIQNGSSVFEGHTGGRGHPFTLWCSESPYSTPDGRWWVRPVGHERRAARILKSNTEYVTFRNGNPDFISHFESL